MMEKLKGLAGGHPILYVLFIIFTWFLVGAVVAGLVSVVQKRSFFEYGPQVSGTLAATFYILVMARRFGWLRASGIGVLGRLDAWLVAIAALVYLVVAYWIAFFGEASISVGYLTASEGVRTIVLRQLVVGPVEEILFRGIVLYALVRVWGNNRRGLLAAAFLSAFLFGAFHLLQAFAGQPPEIALLTALDCMVSGLWWAAFVLLWGTIWPVAFIHAASNSAVLVKALALPGTILTVPGYWLGVLMQLPLVILGLYLVLNRRPNAAVRSLPQQEGSLLESRSRS